MFKGVKLDEDMDDNMTKINFDIHVCVVVAGKTYFYYFTYARPGQVHVIPANYPDWCPGANHADELPFVFGKNAWPGGVRLNLTSGERDLQTSMMTFWTNFAKTG